MKVRIGQMVGYMDTRYLRQDICELSAVLPELTVTNSTCLRKLPQNDSENIKDVPRDARVTAIGVRNDEWVQVVYEGEIGFVRASNMTPKLQFHQ